MCTDLEPVNGTAVDQRGEHPQSGAECISNGTHGQHHMQLLTDTINEHVEEGQRCAVCLLGLISLPERQHGCTYTQGYGHMQGYMLLQHDG